MKVRSGFVSNSSTTSFLIYGTILKDGEENKVYSKELSIEYGPDYDDKIYLGASWDTVQDYETGKQFKERVKNSIETVLGREVECNTYQEAYRDG